MPAHDALLLKIFSGPHAGAEIVLTEQEYLIGRGDACDVLLFDDGIQEQHARLVISGGRLIVSAIDQALMFVDGQPCVESELQSFQFLTLGSTNIACGPQNETWPALQLPVVQHVEVAEEPASDLADPIDESTTQTLAEQPANATRSGGMRWVAAAVLLLLLSGGGIYVATVMASPGETEAPVSVSLEQLQQVVAKVAPDSTVQISEEDDRYVATGYVVAKKTAADLEDALLEATPEVDTDGIRDTESLVKSVRSFLRMRKLSELTAQLGTQPGEVAVMGVVEDLTEWKKAKREIEAKTRVASLLDQVMTPRQAELFVNEQEALEQQKAAESAAVSTEVTDDAQNLKPEIEDEVPTPLSIARKVLGRKRPTRKPVTPPNQLTVVRTPESSQTTTAASDTPTKTQRLPFRITDVTIGRTTFFSIDSGVHVTEKSMINGHYVKSIGPDKVVLEKDGRELVVRLDF